MNRSIGITFVALSVLAPVAPLAGQSLFATRGLGLPTAPVDARARALGGIGLGLLGLNTSLVNPADVAGLGRRGIAAVLQPGTASAEIGGETGDLDASRFPVVRVMYPFSSRLVASIGYGSMLEQSWGVTEDRVEEIGADSVAVTDVIQSTGGIARMSIGVAYQVAPSLSIGLAGGMHTGNLDRRITRSFADTTIGLLPFETRLRWDYRGLFATGGVRIDVPDVVRLSSSITLSEDLDINGRDEEARDDRVKMPVRINAGASGALSSTLLLALGGEYTGGGTARLFQATDATSMRRSTWRLGGGLEYEGIGSAARSLPIRLGGSWSQLPYFAQDEAPATEWAASFGVGFRVQPGQGLAVGDLTIERGNRSGLESTALPGGLSESFWRVTISLSLFGN
jgi:hypothetical protein